MARVIAIAYDEGSAGEFERLAAHGHEVIVVKNAAEAVETIATEPLDVLLLDWWIADMSAIHLMDELGERGLRGKVRSLLVTTNTDERDIRRAFQRGVDGYVGRPFSELELAGAVNRVLVSTEEQLAERREEELSKARILETLSRIEDIDE